MCVFVLLGYGPQKNLTSFLIDISHSLVSLFWCCHGTVVTHVFLLRDCTGMNLNKLCLIASALIKLFAECSSVLRLAMAKKDVINPSAYSKVQSV